MAFTLTIDTDNAAFGEDDDLDRADEVARILHQLADHLGEAVGFLPAGDAVRDINGNTVGRWELTR